jgi:hypothetical protein
VSIGQADFRGKRSVYPQIVGTALKLSNTSPVVNRVIFEVIGDTAQFDLDKNGTDSYYFLSLTLFPGLGLAFCACRVGNPSWREEIMG